MNRFYGNHFFIVPCPHTSTHDFSLSPLTPLDKYAITFYVVLFLYHNSNDSNNAGNIIEIDVRFAIFSAFLLQTFHYINITKSILSRYIFVKMVSTCEIFKNYAPCSSSCTRTLSYVSLIFTSLSLFTWAY